MFFVGFGWFGGGFWMVWGWFWAVCLLGFCCFGTTKRLEDRRDAGPLPGRGHRGGLGGSKVQDANGASVGVGVVGWEVLWVFSIGFL